MEQDEERVTLEMPVSERYELDDEERAEVLLDWAPVVGEA